MGTENAGRPTGSENAISTALKSITEMMPSATQSGGNKGRKGSRKSRKGSRRGYKKGGQGVIETAAVPFGLLALQRYFKGSKTSKRGVQRIGKSLKRTLRFKRKSRKHYRKY